MAITGQISASDEVRREDNETAIPAREVRGLLPNWHILSVSKQTGPYTSSALAFHASADMLKAEDLVRRSDQAVWCRADHLDGLIPFVDPVAKVMQRAEAVEALGKSLAFIFSAKDQEVERGEGEIEKFLWSPFSWYVIHVRDQVELFGTDQVKRMLASGALRPDDLILHPEDIHWQFVDEIDWSDDEKVLSTFDFGKVKRDRILQIAKAQAGLRPLKPKARLVGHRSSVSCIAFSHDGRLLVSGGFDQSIRLWSVSTGTQLSCWVGHSKTISLLAFSPDNSSVASSSWDGTVRLWDVRTGEERLCMSGHSKAANAVAFLPHGRELVSGGLDGTIRVWDVLTGRETNRIDAKGPVLHLAVVPTGTHLLSSSPHQWLLLWNLETSEMVFRRGARRAPGIGNISISRDGALVAAAGSVGELRLGPATRHSSTGSSRDEQDDEFDDRRFQGRVYLWKVSESYPIDAQRWNAHSDRVWSVAIAPSGKTLATASSDGTGKVWDIQSMNALYILQGHEGAVHDIAFSPNEELLATGGEDADVLLWSLRGFPLP